MSTLIRADITRIIRAADPPRDYCSNTVYHKDLGSVFDPDTGWQNHANELRDLFAGDAVGSGSTFGFYRGTTITVKVYDMADPKPRPIKATATKAPAFSSAALAPRLLACCLSYYGGQNLPRHRGRIYIGPFLNAETGETVPSDIQAGLLDLGHGLFDIGGENISHVVHSPTANAETVVSDYWVNDLWDVMHSREEKEQGRVRLHP